MKPHRIKCEGGPIGGGHFRIENDERFPADPPETIALPGGHYVLDEHVVARRRKNRSTGKMVKKDMTEFVYRWVSGTFVYKSDGET